MEKIILKEKLTNILIFSLIGAILFTYASTFFYQKELALTTAGEFTKDEAVRMNLTTSIYRGWPSIIFWGGLELPKVSSVGELVGYIPAYLFYFVMIGLYLVPNLLFWGLVSFVLVIIYYSLLRFLGK